MEQSFIKYIHELFKKLIEVHDFKLKTKLTEGQSFCIEFSSGNFVVKIEKYFREFYTTLYKINNPDNEINLFNLLEYLKQGSKAVPKSEYFRKEKDIEECYRKQLVHVSSVIYDNYSLIIDFFNQNSYENNLKKFEKYWKNKHPEFYKKA